MSDESSISIDRALRQELESWRRAGLTHLPMPPRKRETPVATNEKPSVTRSPVTGGNVPRSASSFRAPAPSISRPAATSQKNLTTEAQPTMTAMPVISTPMPPSPHPAGTREDRVWRLEQLQQCVAGCQRCPELAKTRNKTVFGVGSPEAKIMFVGEAPGADEDAQGIPFVGAAGQLLDKIIVASGLKRDELYICNILRCRPPGNRKPLPDEAANCREYLDGQIAVINPDYIICWGATAAQNLMATDQSIGKLRGQFFQYGRAKVLCTYHPSYLLRNPAAKKDVWEDMKLFLHEAGLPVPGGA